MDDDEKKPVHFSDGTQKDVLDGIGIDRQCDHTFCRRCAKEWIDYKRAKGGLKGCPNKCQSNNPNIAEVGDDARTNDERVADKTAAE
jgi:hypothetical protein